MLHSSVCQSVRATPGAVKPKKTRNKVEGFLHSANVASATFAGHSANAAWINGRKTNEYGKDQRTGRKAGVHL